MSVLRLLVLSLCMHSAVMAEYKKPKRAQQDHTIKYVITGVLGALVAGIMGAGMYMLWKPKEGREGGGVIGAPIQFSTNNPMTHSTVDPFTGERGQPVQRVKAWEDKQ